MDLQILDMEGARPEHSTVIVSFVLLFTGRGREVFSCAFCTQNPRLPAPK